MTALPALPGCDAFALGAGFFVESLHAPKPLVSLTFLANSFQATRLATKNSQILALALVSLETRLFIGVIEGSAQGFSLEVLERAGCNHFVSRASRAITFDVRGITALPQSPEELAASSGESFLAEAADASLVFAHSMVQPCAGSKWSKKLGKSMRQSSPCERSGWLRFAALLLVSTQLPMCATSPSPCAAKEDCYNTPESEELGRCAPREVACIRGTCRVACPQPCDVVDPMVNSCGDTRLVCSLSKSGDNTLPYCAHGAISCTTADECPLSSPQTADGGAGTWECVDGFCRFPGYEYLWR